MQIFYTLTSSLFTTKRSRESLSWRRIWTVVDSTFEPTLKPPKPPRPFWLFSPVMFAYPSHDTATPFQSRPFGQTPSRRTAGLGSARVSPYAGHNKPQGPHAHAALHAQRAHGEQGGRPDTQFELHRVVSDTHGPSQYPLRSQRDRYTDARASDHPPLLNFTSNFASCHPRVPPFPCSTLPWEHNAPGTVRSQRSGCSES